MVNNNRADRYNVIQQRPGKQLQLLSIIRPCSYRLIFDVFDQILGNILK